MADDIGLDWMIEVFRRVLADDPDTGAIMDILELHILEPRDASEFIYTLLYWAAGLFTTTDPDWSADQFYGMQIVDVRGERESPETKARLAVSQSFVATLNGDSQTAIDLVAPHLIADETAAVALSTALILFRDVVRSLDPAALAAVTRSDIDTFKHRRRGAAFGL